METERPEKTHGVVQGQSCKYKYKLQSHSCDWTVTVLVQAPASTSFPTRFQCPIKVGTRQASKRRQNVTEQKRTDRIGQNRTEQNKVRSNTSFWRGEKMKNNMLIWNNNNVARTMLH